MNYWQLNFTLQDGTYQIFSIAGYCQRVSLKIRLWIHKIFWSKTFWVNKKFRPKNFQAKKNWIKNKCVVQKKLGQKILLIQKINWVQNFWSNIFCSDKNLCQKIFWIEKKIAQTNLMSKKCQVKKIWAKKMLL